MKKMFCFQCEETFRSNGCTLHGICGKSPEVSALMDQLIRQLKIMAVTTKADRNSGRFMARALFATLTNTNFDPARLRELVETAAALSGQYDGEVQPGVVKSGDTESLRELLIYGAKGIAAYTEHAAELGYEDDEIYSFLFEALRSSAMENDPGKLLDKIFEAGQIAARAMKQLDRANTETFGEPEPGQVRCSAGNRPGILISGHDLADLRDLLEESSESGIDIYTHGEMLPAHFYPELKKYPHLYGNYGSSWHNQHRDFAAFNGPIIITTNCLTPVQGSYRDRLYTSGMAGFPGIPHIPDRRRNRPKDFSLLIAMAKNSPAPENIENGTVSGGFARNALLTRSRQLAELAVRGKISRFIIMAGCDGRHPDREYYSRVAGDLPADTVIITAGCAKYRYNKMDFGTVEGIPRLLDAGQCNDCYSIVALALQLQKLLGRSDVNTLPLSFDIAWYEQKAIAVLLALLALGFKNIRLGPTLPAFLTPGVLQKLIKKCGLRKICAPECDIAAMMAGN